MSVVAPISHHFLTVEEQAAIKSTVEAFTLSGRFRLDSDDLPPYAAQKIVSVLDSLAEGQDVRVPPPQAEVSVAQAAKFLDMSEDCVEELLGLGRIEYRQDGDQSMIDRDSLLAFGQRRARRHASLDKIVRMSEEMGLYDE